MYFRIMLSYKTFLYRARKLNATNSWDFDIILFRSPVFDNPTDAMMAFNNNPITEENWIGTLQVIEDGKILEEEIFDSSVLKED